MLKRNSITESSAINLQSILFDLELSKYHTALVAAGYDTITRFVLEPDERLMHDLIDDVPMLKPHARQLIQRLKEAAKK